MAWMAEPQAGNSLHRTIFDGSGAPTDQGGRARRTGARQPHDLPQRPEPWLGGPTPV